MAFHKFFVLPLVALACAATPVQSHAHSASRIGFVISCQDFESLEWMRRHGDSQDQSSYILSYATYVQANGPALQWDQIQHLVRIETNGNNLRMTVLDPTSFNQSANACHESVSIDLQSRAISETADNICLLQETKKLLDDHVFMDTKSVENARSNLARVNYWAGRLLPDRNIRPLSSEGKFREFIGDHLKTNQLNTILLNVDLATRAAGASSCIECDRSRINGKIDNAIKVLRDFNASLGGTINCD